MTELIDFLWECEWMCVCMHSSIWLCHCNENFHSKFLIAYMTWHGKCTEFRQTRHGTRVLPNVKAVLRIFYKIILLFLSLSLAALLAAFCHGPNINCKPHSTKAGIRTFRVVKNHSRLFFSSLNPRLTVWPNAFCYWFI